MSTFQEKMAGFKATVFLRTFGLAKIPLLAFCSPSVIEVTRDRCVVKIPLGYRTKNHLGSMYFGALAIGADCAGGLIAMDRIIKEKLPLSLVFGEFHAKYFKRPEADVIFTCSDGPAVSKLVNEALATVERVSMDVKIIATCPSKLGNEPVAEFTLQLSLKKKSKKVK